MRTTLTEARDWALEESAQWIRSVRNDGIVEDTFKGDKDRALAKRELGRIAFELLERAGVRACGYCGCSEEDACPGGCSWAASNLCSACVEPMPPVRKKRGRR